MIPEPDSRSGCAACVTASCCVRTRPGLTSADLRRLCAATMLAPAEAAELHPVNATDVGADGVYLGDALSAFELCVHKVAFAPGQAPTEGPAGQLRCAFLMRLGPGQHRCGVYGQRPMVCRVFPSELTRMGVMVHNPEAICPPGAWSAARADLVTLRLLHLRLLIERDVYRGFLARWNRATHQLDSLAHADAEQRFLTAALAYEDVVAPLLAPVLDDDDRLQAFGTVWCLAPETHTRPFDLPPGAHRAAARARFGADWPIVEQLRAALDTGGSFAS